MAVASESSERKRALVEAVVASAVVTAVVTAASAFLPDRYVATAVGFLFLGATWALVWRGDDARDRNYTDTSAFGRDYTLVNTGGFDPDSKDPMKSGSTRHVKAFPSR